MSGDFQNTGPHISDKPSVRTGMLSVVWALIPATVASAIFFGPYALYLVLASALAATLFEWPLRKTHHTLRTPLGDGSAFLAGMLFGLTLSPGSPWWIPFLGAALVVLVGKHAFGGLGNNLFNPALVARGILLLAYPALVTAWRVPFAYDTITIATPMEGAEAGFLALFLGNVAGSIGETSALALLVGALYLQWRGFLKWRIPVAFIGAAFVTAYFLGMHPLQAVLSGSLLFGALFMATDWVTSPTGRTACWWYGIGCGVLTILLRQYTVYPEGITFAILLMNGLSPVLERLFADPIFGQVEKRWKRRTTAIAAVVGFLILGLAGYGSIRMHAFLDRFYVTGSVRRDLHDFFPQGSRYVAAYPVERDDIIVERVYSREGAAGYLIYTEKTGFYGPIRMLTVLDNDERIVGLRVIQHNESATLGGLIRRPSFLRQFLRLNTQYPHLAVDRLHAITGATVSSRAVASAIESALKFREEPAPPPRSLVLQDGEKIGTGRGYQGSIRVYVKVANGQIENIEVLEHRETQRIAEPAFPRLIDAILAQQNLDIDAVSGATSSSRGFLEAVQNALDN